MDKVHICISRAHSCCHYRHYRHYSSTYWRKDTYIHTVLFMCSTHNVQRQTRFGNTRNTWKNVVTSDWKKDGSVASVTLTLVVFVALKNFTTLAPNVNETISFSNGTSIFAAADLSSCRYEGQKAARSKRQRKTTFLWMWFSSWARQRTVRL